MVQYIIMVGIPGSGKSVQAQKLAERYNATIYSSDAYRQVMLGDENLQTDNQKIFDCLYHDLRLTLLAGNNAILDATNVSVKNRKRAIDTAHGIECNIIAYVVNTDICECVVRDTDRERNVGLDVILKFANRFQYPMKFEGFNEIILHNKTSNELDVREKTLYAMSNFNQQNKHHLHTLGKHSALLSASFRDERAEAGLLHDIGKMYTQTIGEDGNAHYIGHANRSAYYVTCHPEIVNTTYNFDEVIFYVNEHMHIRDIIKSEKAVDKYKIMWGEERYRKMYEFMQADNRASGTGG